MDNKKNNIIGLIIAVSSAAGEEVCRLLRKRGQFKLQKKVDESIPKKVNKDSGTAIQAFKLEIIPNKNYEGNLGYQIEMPEHEKNEIKANLSFLIGESLNAGLATQSFSGLLKSDIPLNELYRIKDHPELMRGYVLKNGRFTKQASLKEASIVNATPILVYQCLAAVTSQYYQQIITERLDDIDIKLSKIYSHLTSEDLGKLQNQFREFRFLANKTKYNKDDLERAKLYVYECGNIMAKYRLLNKSIELKIGNKITDLKEAQEKINKLKKSQYLEELNMAIHAESLYNIACNITAKIAYSLDEIEDAKEYSSRVSLEYWDEYEYRFQCIRHEILKYLELEEAGAWILKGKIKELKNSQEEIFNDFETNFKKNYSWFNNKVTQYIQIDKNGEIKKYIEIQ